MFEYGMLHATNGGRTDTWNTLFRSVCACCGRLLDAGTRKNIWWIDINAKQMTDSFCGSFWVTSIGPPHRGCVENHHFAGTATWTRNTENPTEIRRPKHQRVAFGSVGHSAERNRCWVAKQQGHAALSKHAYIYVIWPTCWYFKPYRYVVDLLDEMRSAWNTDKHENREKKQEQTSTHTNAKSVARTLRTTRTHANADDDGGLGGKSMSYRRLNEYKCCSFYLFCFYIRISRVNFSV